MSSSLKAALVTGAGSGIGQAIALLLAKEAMAVACIDNNGPTAQATADTIREDGGTAMAVTCDVSVKEQIDRMVTEVARGFGRIDVLVNNAGIGIGGRIEQLTEEDWDQVLAVNLKGPFLCCKAALPHMGEGGRIINISSLAGKRKAVLGDIHYTASKAGLLGFTRHLADDLAPRGITVNAVCPGAVVTPMSGEAFLDPRQVRAIPWAGPPSRKRSHRWSPSWHRRCPPT